MKTSLRAFVPPFMDGKFLCEDYKDKVHPETYTFFIIQKKTASSTRTIQSSLLITLFYFY
ncbi:hypothetical protein BSK63_21905 [Paenibacillus odorifer]|nr:hypothetical protein BSK63_21905 [Paenibacillus odorifer]OME34826.1 hypothetical protein BSK46_19935 [Paenibacillus odorifer]OME42944.1 hypothetical protein BSK58_12480 [Paenibacillus odorifer]